MNVKMQGKKAKTSAANIQEYKNWHATLVELHVMLMVEDGAPFVQGVHSLLIKTNRRRKDQCAGKYLIAVGD